MDKTTWDPLLKYESRGYLAKHYKQLHSNSLSSTKAHQIGSNFTQAREYFSSASAASAVVKPLLLYYGVASLCRAATLLKVIKSTESSLAASHGLTTKDWKGTLSKGNSAILDLEVQCTKGLFNEFVCAIGNGQSYQWLTTNNAIGHFQRDFGAALFLSDGSKLSLGDILSREPDLYHEFQIADHGGTKVDFGLVKDAGALLKIHFLITNESAENLNELAKQYNFPSNATYSLEAHPKLSHLPQLKTFCVAIPGTPDEKKSYAPLADGQENDFGRIVRPMPNGDNLIDVHRMVIEAFILGMFSRYYPARWISLLHGEKNDLARTVVIKAIERIEKSFPKVLSDQLI